MLSISRSTIAVAVTLLVACACDKGAKNGGGTGTSANAVIVADDPKTVVAKYNGKTITLGDLETAPGGEKLFEMEEQRYQTRRQVIDQLIFKELVEAEAKKAGKTEEQWMQEQVETKVKPPSDAEIQAFFEQNKEGMPPGTTLDMVKPRIIDFMTRDQKGTLVRALFDDLKKKAGVEITLAAPKKPKKEVEAKGPARGPESAKVTIVEFSDFQCPFCQRVAPTLKRLRETYGDKVRIVWKDFPLTQIHPQAFAAGEAAHCAGEQGKFWEYHDRLFANQQALQPANLKQYAADLQLDTAQFNACLDSSKYGERVSAGVSQGSRLGVNSTPSLYINGRLLSGAHPYETFVAIIDEELARAR
jgi:protein-disulfide isomerase